LRYIRKEDKIMHLNFHQKISLLLFVVIIFSGCSISFGERPSSVMEVKDRSFPVTGEVREVNNVVSIIERVPPWRGRTSLPQAGISLTGVVGQPFFSFRTTITPRVIRLKYQEDDTNWLMPGTKQPYRWNGEIIIEGSSVPATIEFDVLATEKGEDKNFILTNASLGQASLEFDDPLEVLTGLTMPPYPFLIGYAHISNSRYRIYAVIDNPPSHNRLILPEIFFSPKQKFQFLNEQNVVIAELEAERGQYTIYDNFPAAEIGELKNAIALLVGFRHATSILKNIEDSWDLNMFYRYVYP
jgi:hypothetical protein